MVQRKPYFLLATILIVGCAAGVGFGWWVQQPGGWAGGGRSLAVPESIRNLQDSFARVSDLCTPSVVHITVNTKARVLTEFGWPSRAEQQAVGSGVVVSSEGYILTNNHVVRGTKGLVVRFVEGNEYPAHVIGADEETDLAVIRIDGAEDIKPAAFGNSDEVRVGDWVLAIGSPFGLNHTVTAGIISAKGRHIDPQIATYQDFLQTDASINPGNSGGALVNIRGEIIGINTAIVSQTRGNDGVGFAIPINLAKWVKDRLIKDKKVRRGGLGIERGILDEALASEKYGYASLQEMLDELGLDRPRGVFITRVVEGGPADQAGMKERDVLLELDGKKVEDWNDLLFRVAQVEPGRRVTVAVLRNRKERELTVTMGERSSILKEMQNSRRKQDE